MEKFTTENFTEEVVNSSLPVIVDFWAEWCRPCQILSPTIEKIAEEFEGKVKVGKVNVDEEAQIATRFSVMSIPTLLFFKEGKEISRSVGVVSKDEIVKRIGELL